MCYKKGLSILECVAPDSLFANELYGVIGVIHEAQDNPQEALDFFLKAYLIIQKRDFAPEELDSLYDAADLIRCAEKVIENDPNNKYAYAAKGIALIAQDNPTESLKAFDQALTCDPEYGDVVIYRLELITELAEKTGSFRSILAEIRKALQLKRTSYGVNNQRELEERAGISDKESINVPLGIKYEAGSKEYIKCVEEIFLTVKTIMDKEILDTRFTMLDENLGLLDKQISKLENSVARLKSAK